MHTQFSIRYSVYFILMLISLSGFGTLQATQIPVSQNGDSGTGSLRSAIAGAMTGDTIYFEIRGSILLESHLAIQKNLTIIGPGPDSLILDGQDKKRIMEVDSSISLYVYGLTFTRGNAILDSTDAFIGGGAIRNFGFTSLEACLLKNNFAGYGGAIENAGNNMGHAEINLRDCSFVGNNANPAENPPFNLPKAGGAIYSNAFFGGKAKIRAVNTTFSGNESGFAGGGIQIFQDQGDSTISLECTHCTFAYNIARDAAGVDTDRYGLTSLKNTIIGPNQGGGRNPDFFGNASSKGGLLISKIELNSSIGYTPGPGDLINVDPELGPLDNYGGLTPTHSLTCKSPAVDGGVNTPGVPTDQRGRGRIGAPDLGSVERDNDYEILITSKDNGGVGTLRSAVANACPGDTLDLSGLAGTIKLTSAIVLDKDLYLKGNPSIGLWITASGPTRIFEVDTQVTASLSHLTLAYGRPEQFGGGAIINRGSLSLSACTFFKNKAISGGAIGNYGDGSDAVLEASNCTFSGNTASLLDGGAIDNYRFTHPTKAIFKHCTFTNNSAEKRGGAIYNEANAEVQLYNSLLGGDSARTGEELYGDFISLGNNLISDDQEYTLSGGSGDILNQNPQLGPLQYHGGSTYTHQLLMGSPAIDAGNNDDVSDTDQRGYARIFNNTTDIGAYEYDPATGLEQLSSQQFSLYPNPSKGNFQVEWSDELGNVRLIQLIDLQGKVLYQKKFSTENRLNHFFVEKAGLPFGLYILRIQGDNWLGTQKVLIK